MACWNAAAESVSDCDRTLGKMLIDTHCHLDAAEFDGDRTQVVARAAAGGVRSIVLR